MIVLDSRTKIARWFAWCCDNLPMTVTREYGEGKPDGGLRRGSAYYLERGTTLCHFFWAALWVPLIAVVVIAGCLALLVLVHALSGLTPVGRVCDAAGCREGLAVDKYGYVAFFFPDLGVVGVVIAAALIVSTIFGADQSGFSKLLGYYLKGLKNRVCPMIQFSEEEDI